MNQHQITESKKALQILENRIKAFRESGLGSAYPLELVKESFEKLLKDVERLQHFESTVTGLWAVDKDPKECSHEWIKDNCFEIGENEN